MAKMMLTKGTTMSTILSRLIIPFTGSVSRLKKLMEMASRKQQVSQHKTVAQDVVDDVFGNFENRHPVVFICGFCRSANVEVVTDSALGLS